MLRLFSEGRIWKIENYSSASKNGKRINPKVRATTSRSVLKNRSEPQFQKFDILDRALVARFFSPLLMRETRDFTKGQDKLNQQKRLEEQQAKIAAQIERLQKAIIEEREKNYKEVKAIFSKIIQLCVDKNIDPAVLKENLLEIQSSIVKFQKEGNQSGQPGIKSDTESKNLKSEENEREPVSSISSKSENISPGIAEDIAANPYHLDIISE